MATLQIFYFDGTSFAQANSVYDDPALTTLAADGFYSNEIITRQQLNGVLLNAQPCASCAVDCGSGINASFSDPGFFDANVNLANSTGATVIYAYMTSSIPDGIIANYNNVNYNRLTAKNNHNGVTLVEGNNVQVDYAGINNQGTNLPTYVGNQDADLLANSPYSNIDEYSYSNATNNYVATGQTRSITVSSTQIGFATDASTIPSPVFTMVVPKTEVSVTNINVQIFAPDTGTAFDWEILCPVALPSFQGSNLQLTDACAANAATYYFVRNATGINPPFTKDTNTTPEVGNFVFTQPDGSVYLNDTNSLKYVIVNGTTALGIRNGVVVSIASCSGSPSLTSFLASPSQTFNQICGPGAVPAQPNVAYFHSGSAAYPIAGDTVYTTNAGTTALAAGLYFTFGGGGSNTYFEITGNQGLVTNVTSCIPS
tara:strand:+ start:362 stop:1645 length:1284 start_codon:yes stop_codon:yes gene_type:complete